MTRSLTLLLLFSGAALAGGGSERPTSSFERQVRMLATQLGTLEAQYERAWPAGNSAVVENIVTDGRQAFSISEGRVKGASVAGAQEYLNFDQQIAFSYDARSFRAFYLVRNGVLSAPELAALITHENFHFFRQSYGWFQGNDASRAQQYPVMSEPRAYRHAMFQAMQQALLDPANRPQLLRQAAGFYGRWKSLFPHEAQDAVWADNIEGSAEYFTHQPRLLALYGDRPTAAQLGLYLRATAQELVYRPGLDSEAYSLGTVSGLLLDASAQRATWKADVMAGASSLQLLLGRTQPAYSAIPEQSRQLAEKYRLSTEAELAPLLRESLALWRSGAPLLTVADGRRSSFSPVGFFRAADIAGYDLVPMNSAVVDTPQGPLDLAGLTVLMRPGEYGLLLDPRWLEARGTALILRHPKFPQPFELSRQPDQDGRAVYTLAGSAP